MASQTTYHIGGYIPAAPQQNRSEFYDGAGGTYTAWDTAGVQTAGRALSAGEIAAFAAQDFAVVASTNKDSLQAKAQAALNANATFLALAAPTNAQTLAQVQLLTKENNALIRMALNLYDTVAGT